MRTSFRQAVFATTAIIGLSGFAFAAAAAPPAAGNPTAAPPAAAPSGQAAAPAKPAVHRNQESMVEQRIADLHARLKITPAEEAQWGQFAQVMRDNAVAIDQAFQSRVKALPTMTAADNVKSYADLSAEHAQEMQKLVPVFQALYGTMPDSQKHLADQVFRADANRGAPAKHS
jgi:pyruvate/2-oxoglutarate dehydrogenase complex dihydrolipoamide acyltransferase (E2) component